MRLLVRDLFVIADFVCWALIFLGIVGAITSPMTLQIQARMAHRAPSTLFIVIAVVWWTLVAAGSYAVLKRRVYGAIPLFAPAVWLAWGGVGFLAVMGAAMIPVLLLLPYAAIWLGGRRQSRA